jgi:hypothetical protein
MRLKRIFYLCVLLVVGCAKVLPKNIIPNNGDKWAYIDNIPVCCVDTAFEYMSGLNRIYGLCNGDTIWLTSKSILISYENVVGLDSSELIYRRITVDGMKKGIFAKISN